MSYKNQTILNTIKGINNTYYLPSIQRKFVWSMQQIEDLFDSILQGYPIGTFLFWSVEKGDNPSHIDQYVFYEFINKYCDKDDSEFIQKKLSKPSCKDKIIAVLDGQQRLSSLYCAIQGSYAVKTSKKISPDNPYPPRELYLNLLYEPKLETDSANEFKFLTESEAKKKDINQYWLKVKEVIKWSSDEGGVVYVKKQAKELVKKIKGEFSTISDNELEDIEIKIELLWTKLVKEELITFYEINRSDLDEILDIFVRVNSAGTQLSKSDLVFSTIVARWEEGREKIEDLLETLNDKGDGFKFDKDFIINLCLSLMDLPQKFAVKTFTLDNVNRVKTSWNCIVGAISAAVDLLVEFGFSDENLTADYIIIPVAYYLFKSGKKIKNLSPDEKNDIRKFLIFGMIKKIFSGGVDGVLTALLNELRYQQEDGTQEYVLKNPESFDFASLRKLKFQDRKLNIDVVDLEAILDLKKGPLTFMVLSLLYPQIKFNEEKWHQDHIHPKTLFDKSKLKKYLKTVNVSVDDDKLNDWKYKADTIVNLQLLKGNKNQSKGQTSLSAWIASQYKSEEELKEYTTTNYIEKSAGFELYSFEAFYKARRELLKVQLANIFDIDLSESDAEELNSEEVADSMSNTIADAIYKVLREYPEGLTVQEIYDKIVEQNLYVFGAKNPKSVVSITIQRWCDGSKISRGNSVKIFKVVQEVDGEIYYGLIPKADFAD